MVKTIRFGNLLASLVVKPTTARALQCVCMSDLEVKAVGRKQKLRERLVALEAEFRSAALQRGFDLTQMGNMALPTPLAAIFAECAGIRAELEDEPVED